jgi:hypothetical protein
MDRLRGCGDTVKVQAFYRFHLPILADGTRDPLNQLVSAGLLSVYFTIDLPGVPGIHSDFSLFPICHFLQLAESYNDLRELLYQSCPLGSKIHGEQVNLARFLANNLDFYSMTAARHIGLT